MTEHEHDPAEHDPVESGRPTIGRRDQPDALRPDAEDRPDRKLPPEPEEDGAADNDAPDAPRPTESPAGRD
jgi:hypothetical protein